MASRDLNDLDPRLKDLAKKMILKCKKQGLDYLIYCTYRSNEEQEKVFKEGKSKLRAGQSKHNYFCKECGRPASRAFDGIPLVGGKAMWDTRHPSWQIVQEVGKSLRLKWGGDWKRFKDCVHWELP